MSEQKTTLKECIEQLKSCGFECEAGPLQCSLAFKQLETAVGRIEFEFEKHQRDKHLIGVTTLSTSLVIEHTGRWIKYILTGCSDDTVSEIELKNMGYLE